MKLISYVHEGRQSYGAVADSLVVDLGAQHPEPTLKAFLASNKWRDASVLAAHASCRLEEVTLLPPIPEPTHIIALGLNTKSHFEETREIMKRKPDDPYPRHPRLFLRSPLSQVGHLGRLLVPRVSRELDYEGEIAVVLGSPCRHIREEEALEYVAGFSCFNEGSVRDYQLHAPQMTAGKNFYCSGGFGPWITTTDEVGDPSRLHLSTEVNGEVRQRMDVSDLIFSFAQIISYTSSIFSLQPGDVLVTGSPAGIGALSKSWLVAGDRVDVSVSGVGTLTNFVDNEQAETDA